MKNRYFRVGILAFMFLGSWFGQWMTCEEGGMKFWNATFENWQSEFLQLGTAIVLLAASEKLFGEKDSGGDD